jgi:starch phosphorylase
MKIADDYIDYAEQSVAYFSMEIGLDAKIPTYSGGLGVLAGDTLKSCADLELPLIAITLLYKKGYFKQYIDESGMQHEEPVKWDPHAFMTPLQNKVKIKIANRDVWIRPWLYVLEGVTGRRNPILFLDTDLEENSEQDRYLTHHLYGHDEVYRLSQEIILGIGGVRVLKELGCVNLKKYHMNEGHSALLSLELYKTSTAKDKIKDVRQKCVFTTHTPVPAGHDQFPRALAENLLTDYLTPKIKENLFYNNKLNMTFVGLRYSEYINGVAKKHGEVSRGMFPGYHIESITNGIHSSYWTAEPMKKLFDKFLPGWDVDPFNLRYVLSIPKEEVWKAHNKSKKALISFVNKNYKKDMDDETFTIGFARRAATYKRGDMLFSDLERLKKIAKKSKGLQIIYAGKAHPKDWEGKQVIKRIHEAMGQLKDVLFQHKLSVSLLIS